MLLAARCAACDRPGGSPCSSCHGELRPAPSAPHPVGLDDLVVALSYEGPARALVAGVKVRNRRQTVAWLVEALVRALSAAGPAVETVSWVPTTAAHRRQRGFDHGEVLARALARRLGLPCAGLLRRLPGPPQTGRPAWERRIDGPRFDLRVPVARSTGVLLVDDVVTTGATLRAAVGVLRAAGLVVVPAAVARTPRRSASIGSPSVMGGGGRSGDPGASEP